MLISRPTRSARRCTVPSTGSLTGSDVIGRQHRQRRHPGLPRHERRLRGLPARRAGRRRRHRRLGDGVPRPRRPTPRPAPTATTSTCARRPWPRCSRRSSTSCSPARSATASTLITHRGRGHADGRLRHAAHRRHQPRHAPDLARRARQQHRQRQHRHAPPAEHAFQAQIVVAQSSPARAAASTSPASRSATPRAASVYQPDHPLADADGYVRAARHRHGQPDDPAGHGPARLPGLGAGHQERPGHLLQRPQIGTRLMSIPGSRPSAVHPARRADTSPPRLGRRRRRGLAGRRPSARPGPTSATCCSTGIESLEGAARQGRQPRRPGRHRRPRPHPRLHDRRHRGLGHHPADRRRAQQGPRGLQRDHADAV